MKQTHLLVLMFFLSGTLIFNSCNQNQPQETNVETGESEHQPVTEEHHEESTGHEHQHGNSGTVTESSGTKVWTPSGNGVELIKSDFHFITGNADNIMPEVIQSSGGKNVLEITGDGTPAAFVFHQKYGNVGLSSTIRRIGFQGSLKLIHHALNMSDYEFVAITDKTMKLGRVENGQEKILDESAFSSNQDWVVLKVSAAGTHFKGYIGDKTITHGHGDQMGNGFVGLMVEGTGNIQIESLEVFPLEAE